MIIIITIIKTALSQHNKL